MKTPIQYDQSDEIFKFKLRRLVNQFVEETSGGKGINYCGTFHDFINWLNK